MEDFAAPPHLVGEADGQHVGDQLLRVDGHLVAEEGEASCRGDEKKKSSVIQETDTTIDRSIDRTQSWAFAWGLLFFGYIKRLLSCKNVYSNKLLLSQAY